MKHNGYIIISLLCLSFTLAPIQVAQASKDHDKARFLREAGEIMPLEDILRELTRVYPGKVLEVELERKRGRIVYELEILNDAGEVHEFYIDAKTGRLLKIKRDD